ncbi:MAG: SDR family oxidoreductase [Pseudomonadota bacterium]
MGIHQGKVFWVTGASGALGGAVARHLAGEGARVVASGRSVRAEDFADHPGIEVVPLDVTDDAAVKAATAQLLERHGRLDGVVTSTNVGAFGDFLELDDAQWHSVIEAKLLGTVRVVRAALPALVQQGKGSVVVITGRGGIDPPPNHFPGASVNAALDLLVQGLGRRYGAQGVRTNSIAPGPILSPRYAAMEQSGPDAGKRPDVAIGALGQPVDIAHAASYLLSDASGFVNGSVLKVDGGGPAYRNQ